MYRNFGQSHELAADPDDILAAQRRLRKKQLVAVGVALGALTILGTGGALFLAHRTAHATQEAWERASTCIAGSASEGASARVRASQLVAMSVPVEKRNAAAFDGWPVRCAAPLHAFAEVVKEGGGSAELAETSEKLAKVVSTDQGVTGDLGPAVEKLFAAGLAEKLVAGTSGAPSAGSHGAPLVPRTLATLENDARLLGESITLTSVHRAPFADETLRFVIDDKAFTRGPAVCELASGAHEITCTKVPAPAAAMSPALRLWGTTSPKTHPFVFAGDRGKSGIFRSDTGQAVVDQLEYGAYGATALEDGSLGYLVWRESPPETHFVRVAPGGARKDSFVVSRGESGNPYYSTSVFWSYVVYKSVKADVDGIRLMIRKIDPSGALLPPVDVGHLAETGQIEGGNDEEPHLTGCRSGDTTVIRAKGWHDTYVSFLVSGKWTAPVEAPGLGGTLECRPGEAIVSRVYGGQAGSGFKGGVDVRRCTVSGCDDRSIDLNHVLAENKDVMPRTEGDVRAVDIDGKLLLVWSAGEHGGLRTRFGASGELASASETVFFDDHVRDGKFRDESAMIGFELVPTAHGALLLLGTVDGVFAYLFDASGQAKAITAKL